jgi:hypothetical protein
MNDPQQPYNRGAVMRAPRALAVLALALLIISVPLLGFLFAAGLSEMSPFYLFGGLLSFFAIVVAIFFAAALRRRAAVSSWAPARATVVESEVVWGTNTGGGRTGRTWLPRFTYQYEVGGRVYQGKRIAFYSRCTGLRAQELVARNPVGSLVEVYYDPAQPAEAVMDRGFRALWLLPIFAVVCVALAVIFFKLPTLVTL